MISPTLRRAVSAHKAGDLAAARTHYDSVLAAEPRNAQAHHLAGLLALQVQDLERAALLFTEAARLEPTNAVFVFNLAVVLQSLSRPDDAFTALETTLSLDPKNAEAWVRHADILVTHDKLEMALTSYDKALSLNPKHVNALNNRGHLLRMMMRPVDALASFDKALAVDPDFALGHKNRGLALNDLQRTAEALASWERAIAVNPRYADAYSSYADLLLQVGRHTEAVAALKQALTVQPDLAFGKGYLLHTMMRCCDWDGLSDLGASIDTDVAAGRAAAEPFGYQAYATSEALLKRCAEMFTADRYSDAGCPATVVQPHGDKIRVGYLCGEFRNQATSMLMAGVYEHHDKSRFETYALDNGWDDGSALRRRVLATFDGVIDISKQSDPEAMAAIAARKIDILVNLNGFFGNARPRLFARRAAPIQVNYLGFPGTLGAAYMDYLIADRIVIPESSRAHYTEKIVYLPRSYQANDDRRVVADAAFTRSQLGLPEAGFVFYCFNNNYKITPQTFDGWMRILAAVPGSVLWLLADNPTAVENLQRTAVARGVDPRRLIFAGRMNIDQHLARQRCADLFLDTLPYNAHTTAADALWAGLPLLTCRGRTFPGRVAASLLEALEVPELIAETQADFEARAIHLATHPADLTVLRNRIAASRGGAALFDTAEYTRGLEAAFEKMVERSRLGLAPEHFTVAGPSR